MPLHDKLVKDLSLHSHQDYLLTASLDKTAKVVNFNDKKVLFTLVVLVVVLVAGSRNYHYKLLMMMIINLNKK